MCVSRLVPSQKEEGVSMGRAPCCDKANVKKGPWSPEEDSKLKDFIEKYGTCGNWIALPQKAGLRRCGKSCRLRWLNYLRPNLKHGEFSPEEDRIICNLYASIGSRWSIIAAQLPGRTDNDIKNYWNTKLKKKLLGIPPSTRKSNQQQQQQQQHLEQQQRLFPSSVSTMNIQNSSSLPPKPFLETPELYQIPQTFFHSSSLLQAQINQSLIMFGGEPSSTSSDGSSTQISYGKELDYDFSGGGDQISFENFGILDGNGLFEGTPLELVSSNIVNGGLIHWDETSIGGRSSTLMESQGQGMAMYY